MWLVSWPEKSLWVCACLLSLPNTKNEFPVRCWVGSDWHPHRSSKSGLWKVERWSNRESSATIRARVQAARDIQRERFSNNSSDVICNDDMRVGELRQFCKLQEEGQSLMRAAMSQLNLSARAYHRILKLARTITDLASTEETQSTHLAEALQTARNWWWRRYCSFLTNELIIWCSGSLSEDLKDHSKGKCLDLWTRSYEIRCIPTPRVSLPRSQTISSVR